MSDRRFFSLVGMVTAIAIVFGLYFVYRIYCKTQNEAVENIEIDTPKETEGYDIEILADIFERCNEHNGKSINSGIILSEYDKNGNLIQGNIKLKDLINGVVCIALLSTNNCEGCMRQEIATLKRLGPKGKIIFLFDSSFHKYNYKEKVSVNRYYEFQEGELVPGLNKNQEVPILFYIENGRIVASCFVSNYSMAFTSKFHTFLKNHLNSDENL